MYRQENLREFELNLNDVKCPKCGDTDVRNFFYLKDDYVVGYKVICESCNYIKEKII